MSVPMDRLINAIQRRVQRKHFFKRAVYCRQQAYLPDKDIVSGFS